MGEAPEHSQLFQWGRAVAQVLRGPLWRQLPRSAAPLRSIHLHQLEQFAPGQSLTARGLCYHLLLAANPGGLPPGITPANRPLDPRLLSWLAIILPQTMVRQWLRLEPSLGPKNPLWSSRTSAL